MLNYPLLPLLAFACYSLVSTDPIPSSSQFCAAIHRPGPYAVGPCENIYLDCPNGELEVDNCDGDSVYVEQGNRCVERRRLNCPADYFCSANTHSDFPTLAISRCGKEYLSCNQGNVFVSSCTGGRVFIGEVCRYITPADEEYCYQNDAGNPHPESDSGYGMVQISVTNICTISAGHQDGYPYSVPIATGCGGYFCECLNQQIISIKKCGQDSVLLPSGLCQQHEGCVLPPNHQGGDLYDPHRPYESLMGAVQFCTNHGDGLYKPHPCSPEATFCANHRIFNVFCPPQTTLDFASKQCYPLAHSGCSNENTDEYRPEQFIHKLVVRYCRGDTQGGLHPFRDCDPWFVDCSQLSVHSCQYGTIFDPFAKACVHPDRSSVCYSKLQQHFFPNSQEFKESHENRDHYPPETKQQCDAPHQYVTPGPCSQDYILCLDKGQPLHLSCPLGTMFWLEKKACIPTSSRYAPSECHENAPHTVPNCGQLPQGKITQVLDNCGQYYECVNGQLLVRDCAAGTGFDPQMNSGAGGCNHLDQLRRDCSRLRKE